MFKVDGFKKPFGELTSLVLYGIEFDRLTKDKLVLEIRLKEVKELRSTIASQEQVIARLEARNDKLNSEALLASVEEKEKVANAEMELRKSMSNWDGWMMKYKQLENKLVLATTENDRLKHDLELARESLVKHYQSQVIKETEKPLLQSCSSEEIPASQ